MHLCLWEILGIAGCARPSGNGQ